VINELQDDFAHIVNDSYCKGGLCGDSARVKSCPPCGASRSRSGSVTIIHSAILRGDQSPPIFASAPLTHEFPTLELQRIVSGITPLGIS
jgi:hypothetical protein